MIIEFKQRCAGKRARAGNGWKAGLECLEDRCLLSPVVSVFPVPDSNIPIIGVTAGASGDVWFTRLGDNNLGHVLSDGTFDDFWLASWGSQPEKPEVDPLGNVWVSSIAR